MDDAVAAGETKTPSSALSPSHVKARRLRESLLIRVGSYSIDSARSADLPSGRAASYSKRSLASLRLGKYVVASKASKNLPRSNYYWRARSSIPAAVITAIIARSSVRNDC